MDFVPLLVGLVVSAAFTFFVTPIIIRKMIGRGIVGHDINKLSRPEIPEMGGVSVLFGFMTGMVAIIFMMGYLGSVPDVQLIELLAAFLTILMVGFIGMVDDLIGWKKGLKQWQHALFPIFCAVPLMALAVVQTSIDIPFLGPVQLGILYSLILIPIGITGAANASNMLAGMNGLEAGLGAIITAAVLVIAIAFGATETALLMACMLGALLAFLWFNKFPAKIFPGDSLTLMMGASVAAAVIIGNMEKVGVMLFALYIIEFLIKAKHRFKSECFGVPQKDGTLQPRPEGGSLTQFVMRRGRFTENQVVLIILSTQAVVALAVIAIYLLL